MNCIFCQKPCKLLNVRYECLNHRYLVKFAKYINGHIRYHIIEGEEYSFSYYYRPDDSFWSCFIDKLGDNIISEILRLECDPKVTPENFDHKIKTLLTFS